MLYVVGYGLVVFNEGVCWILLGCLELVLFCLGMVVMVKNFILDINCVCEYFDYDLWVSLWIVFDEFCVWWCV